MVYADTSALVALFARERRGEALRQWLDANPIAGYRISDWGVTEVASALSIKVRRAELNLGHLTQAWQAFGDACDTLLKVESVTAEDFSNAASLCLDPDTGLRSGDALHLAIALRLECSAMISYDDTLNRNAQACGLAVIAP